MRGTPRLAGLLLGLALLGLSACSQEDGESGDPTATATPSTEPTAPSSLAALGDSITAAINADQALAAQPEFSWSTGTEPEVDSIYSRLREVNPGLTAKNYAVPGQRMEHLATQANEVTIGTELVTVLMGANDACTPSPGTMTSVEAFREAARAGFQVLVNRNVQQILIASIPDVYRLWEVGSTSAEARSAWNEYGSCQSMLVEPTSDDRADRTRREQVRERVIEFNEVLENECSELDQAGGETRCRYDGGAVYASGFELSDLSSVDYFHPSPSGQARLAAVVYSVSGYSGGAE